MPSAFLRVRYIRCTLATPKKKKKVSPCLPPCRSRVFLLFSSSFSSCPRVFLESPRVLALSLAPSSSSSRYLWKALQNETTPPSPQSSPAGSTSDPVVSPDTGAMDLLQCLHHSGTIFAPKTQRHLHSFVQSKKATSTSCQLIFILISQVTKGHNGSWRM